MKKQTVKTFIAIATIAAVSAIGTLSATLSATAAEQKAEPNPSGEKKESATKVVTALPFHGKLDSVDTTAKSIKVGERTFHVMTTTKITKDGSKPGTLDDAKVGEAVAGAFHPGDGGQYQLVSLRLGPKPEKKSSSDKKK